MEFTNPNYFRARGKDHDHYRSIVIIFIISIPFPITSAVIFVIVTSLYIQTSEFCSDEKKKHSKVEHKSDEESPTLEDGQPTLEDDHPTSEDEQTATKNDHLTPEDHEYKHGNYFIFEKDQLTFKNSHIISLLVTSVIITIALIVFHIISEV